MVNSESASDQKSTKRISRPIDFRMYNENKAIKHVRKFCQNFKVKFMN